MQSNDGDICLFWVHTSVLSQVKAVNFTSLFCPLVSMYTHKANTAWRLYGLSSFLIKCHKCSIYINKTNNVNDADVINKAYKAYMEPYNLFSNSCDISIFSTRLRMLVTSVVSISIRQHSPWARCYRRPAELFITGLNTQVPRFSERSD